VDFSVFKISPLFDEAQVEFRAEAFNLTNTPVFAAPGSVVGTPTFGAVSSDVSTHAKTTAVRSKNNLQDTLRCTPKYTNKIWRIYNCPYE
jgi:hypothetical protein